MTKAESKRVTEFLAEVASYDYVEDPIPKSICAKAAGLMVKLNPVKPRPRKSLAPGRMKPSREEYRTELQRIRGELCDISKGLCERCGLWVEPGCGHVHHTISGSGKRRQQQSVETCAFLCPSCHRALHREPQLAREFRERLKIIRSSRTP
jgi:5-methylcytosine-specific restriction endonuclease McrA